MEEMRVKQRKWEVVKMKCFCPSVKNEDELLLMVKQGTFDGGIYEYLTEAMLEYPNKKLDYPPTELFEMHVDLLDKNETLFYQFSDINESGVYDSRGNSYIMTKEQRKIFDLMVEIINHSYEYLVKLVDGE